MFIADSDRIDEGKFQQYCWGILDWIKKGNVYQTDNLSFYIFYKNKY